MVALVALTLVASAPLTASAASHSRVLPPPDRSHGTYSRAQALDVLDQARQQLRPETRRERTRTPSVRSVDTDVTMTLRDLFRARTALAGADRRDADELLSRGRVYTDGTSDPVSVSTPEMSCSTNFCVHYRAYSGADRESSTTAEVSATLQTLENVRAYETGTLGFRLPVLDTPTTPTPDNPDSRIDVFLGDLGRQGIYGYCAPDGAQNDGSGHVAAFCVLDNDFARAQYGATPLNSLRVTAAHEFFHAVQFAYDVNEDTWFMEGTAVWMEDEVYDSINDNYQYLAVSPLRYPRTPMDYSVGLHPYGAFLFFKYASDRLRPDVIRQFWESADASQDRYSLQAIRAVVAARKTSWSAFFSTFASWNTLPAHGYGEGAAYPAPSLSLTRVLTERSRSTGWRSLNLAHLSSSAIRVAPDRRLKPRRNLVIEVNAPDASHGSTALVQRRYRNGVVVVSAMRLNASGNGRALLRFDRRTLSSLLIILSNTSSTMRDCGRIGDSSGGPIYSCYGRGVYDSGQIFSVRATVR